MDKENKGLTRDELKTIADERINFLETGEIPGVDMHTGRNLIACGVSALVGLFSFVPLLVVWYMNNTYFGASEVELFNFLSMNNNGDNMGISILVSLGIVGLAVFGLCCLVALIFTGSLNGPDFTEKYEEECKKTIEAGTAYRKILDEEVKPYMEEMDKEVRCYANENARLEKLLKKKEDSYNSKVGELNKKLSKSEHDNYALIKDMDGLKEDIKLLKRQLEGAKEDTKIAVKKKDYAYDELKSKYRMLEETNKHLKIRLNSRKKEQTLKEIEDCEEDPLGGVYGV